MNHIPFEILKSLAHSPLFHLKNYPTITNQEGYKMALHSFMSEFVLYHILKDYDEYSLFCPAGVRHFLRIYKNMILQIKEQADNYCNTIEPKIDIFIDEYKKYNKLKRCPESHILNKAELKRRPQPPIFNEVYFKQYQEPKLFVHFASVCLVIGIDPKIELYHLITSPLHGSNTFLSIKRVLEKHSRILKLDAYPVITTPDQYKQAHQAFKKETYLYYILCQYTYPKLDRAPHVQDFCNMLLQLGNAMIAWHNQENNKDFVAGCTELTFIFGIVRILTSHFQNNDKNISLEFYQHLHDLVTFVHKERVNRWNQTKRRTDSKIKK